MAQQYSTGHSSTLLLHSMHQYMYHLYHSMAQQHSTVHCSTLLLHSTTSKRTPGTLPRLSSTLLISSTLLPHSIYQEKYPLYRSMAQQHSTGHSTTVTQYVRSMAQQYSTGHSSTLLLHSMHQYMYPLYRSMAQQPLLFTAVPYCYTVLPVNVPPVPYHDSAVLCWSLRYPTATQYTSYTSKVPPLPQHG